MGQESTSTRCKSVARHMLRYGRPLSQDEIINHIMAITPDDILTYAQKILVQPPTVASIGPVKNVPNYHKLKSLAL